MNNHFATSVFSGLMAVRQRQPLVLNVTNMVVMNQSANVLLAIGASPLMAHCQQELNELVELAQALVINIGTLDEHTFASMLLAAHCAVRHQKPVVIDPVGCHVSQFRLDSVKQLLNVVRPLTDKVTLRGNAAEIMALVGASQTSIGLDALTTSEAALESGKWLRAQYGCQVLLSGVVDYHVAEQVFKLQNGDAMLTKVTGMGCSLSAMIAAFASINSELPAGVLATSTLAIAAELAMLQSHGPGSFQVNLLDQLYSLGADAIVTRLVMQVHHD